MTIDEVRAAMPVVLRPGDSYTIWRIPRDGSGNTAEPVEDGIYSPGTS